METQIVNRLAPVLFAASSEPGNPEHLLYFTLQHISNNCPKAWRVFRIFTRTMELTLSEMSVICYNMKHLIEYELSVLLPVLHIYFVFWRKLYGGPHTIISVCSFNAFSENPLILGVRDQLVLLEKPRQSLNKNDFFR